MNITVFQSHKGDCLLLSSGSGIRTKYVLVDGGMPQSFREHVAPRLAQLPRLDLIYVSHIDDDHIGGVLELMNNAFEWKVYDRRKDTHPEPKVPRPPKNGIRAIWHNAFHDMVPGNGGELADFLMATANAASGSDDEAMQQAAVLSENYATSIPQAIELTHRIGIRQLKLNVNQGTRELMMVRDEQKPIRLGGMTFTILGPFDEDLKKLRKEWNEWLNIAKNRKKVMGMRDRANADAKAITTASLDELTEQMLVQAEKLGDPGAVTPPNLASLMLLVREGRKSVLLTGDGIAATILKGLEQAGEIDEGGSLHVNVLKVQHHGARNNIDRDFCKRITADHYIFCGNGAYTNPELDVVQWIYDSRAADKRRFRFWFNSHSSITDVKYRPHMKKLERKAAELVRKSRGRLRAEFLRRSAFPPIRI